MNHTIKGILIVAAITSMLVLGATTVPIMQSSFASKKHDFKKAERDPNININKNSADSSSTSDATAENTNNIDNTATANQSQSQTACAVNLACDTTVTVGPPSPPPTNPCPHDPYTTFSGGLCQNGPPSSTTCNPNNVGGHTATPTDGTCTATGPAGDVNAASCPTGQAGITNGQGNQRTCTFPSTPGTCPPAADTGEVGTVDPASGNCAIQPET